MREIKFRAWDEYTKDMQYMDDSVYFGLSAGDILNRFSTVMQYTGLHDINDVEIYEGDKISINIDKCEYGSYYYSGTGTVVFEYGSFMINWGDISELLYGVHLDAVVVGNIYENPELV